MADVNVVTRFAMPATAAAAAAPAEPDYELIEGLFFAYRDFVGEADETLAELGFGRAHHRVLHFVNRSPGMRVTDLLETLRITKQSLGRVLKQLVDDGYIEQRPGDQDRRERLLATTARGRTLVEDLAMRQTQRIAAALADLPAEARAHVAAFLGRMSDHRPGGKP